MKGLLRKDFYLAFRYCRMFLLVDAVFFAASFFNEGMSIFIAYPCILAGVIPMTLFAYDEREKWNICCLTLPVSRKQYVSAKYIMGLIFLGGTLLATGVVLAASMAGSFSLQEYLLTLAAMAGVNLLGNAVLMPLAFRFGVEKARIAYYLVIGVMCAAMVIFSDVIDGAAILQGSWFWAGLTAIIAIYALSWLLSMAAYRKREL